MMKTVEHGEPTQLINVLLQELSSRIKLDLGPVLADKLIGKTEVSGMDLINQVLANPQIMWKRYFFVELRKLSQE